MIQYSRDASLLSIRLGVLDTPPSRGMTKNGADISRSHHPRLFLRLLDQFLADDCFRLGMMKIIVEAQASESANTAALSGAGVVK